MSQGITIKGKTAAGQNVEVLVDSTGNLYLKTVNASGTNINPATEDTLAAILAKIDVYVPNETPTGTKNGVNKIFTTFYNYKPNTIRVSLNGLRQVQPGDYTETSANTFTFVNAPLSGDVIVVDYIKT